MQEQNDEIRTERREIKHVSAEENTVKPVVHGVKKRVSLPTESDSKIAAEPAAETKDESVIEQLQTAESEAAEEEVPTYEEPENNSSNGGSPLIFCLKIGAILLAVCAAVTLVLAVVNSITEDRIAENKTADINVAISEIFTKSDRSTEADVAFANPVTGVYNVMKGENQIGYAVYVITTGFGGDIEMLVGINADGSVAGVRIISMSETAGVGSRVNDVDYLSGYIGKSGTLAIRSDVDAISGATISSKAVLAGVNAATALNLKVEGGIVDDEPEDESSDASDGTEDASALEVDTELEVIPVTDEVSKVSVETVFRGETAAVESEPEETVIISIDTTEATVTEAPADTTVAEAPADETTVAAETTAADTAAEETTAATDTAESAETTVSAAE